jgi:hypothetical protein
MTSRKFRGQPTMTIQALVGRPPANVNQNDAGAF